MRKRLISVYFAGGGGIINNANIIASNRRKNLYILSLLLKIVIAVYFFTRKIRQLLFDTILQLTNLLLTPLPQLYFSLRKKKATCTLTPNFPRYYKKTVAELIEVSASATVISVLYNILYNLTLFDHGSF